MHRYIVTAALVALACATAASAAQTGGLILLKSTAIDGRDSLLALPGEGYSSHSLELAAVADGSAAGIRYRLRAEASGRTGTGWPGHATIRVKELSWGRRLNDAWSFSLGKQLRSWDSGLAAQPLGFFHAGPDITDPLDFESRIEGLPMLVVTRLGEVVNVEGLVSAPLSNARQLDWENRRQVAVRISGSPAPSLNTSLVLRQRFGVAPGVGASLSYAAGLFEFHGDAYYGRPEAHYTYAGFTDAAPAVHTVDPFRLVSEAAANLRTIVGLTWTPTAGINLRAEWSHTPDAPSQRQWSQYLAGIAAHRSALSAAQPGLAFQNLAWDLAARATQRDHVYVSGDFERGDLRCSLSLLATPNDGSAILSPSLAWKLPYRISTTIGLSIFLGGARSEFGLLPYHTSLRASLSRAF